VLDIDNAFGGLRERYRAAGLDYGWFSTTVDDEVRAYRRADILVAIAPAESERARALVPERPVVVAGHAHPPTDARGAGAQTVLLVGSENPANAAALAELARAWPDVVRHHPQATLLVAGTISNAALRPAAGCHVLGVVPDVGSLYRRAAIVVNIVRAGAGVSIKTVEALAHGKCVVATEEGARGLPGARDAISLLDDPSQVGRRIVELLGDPERISRHEDRAYAYARARLAPGRVFAALEAAIAARLEGSAPHQAAAELAEGEAAAPRRGGDRRGRRTRRHEGIDTHVRQDADAGGEPDRHADGAAG
jgi:hypothetical protein